MANFQIDRGFPIAIAEIHPRDARAKLGQRNAPEPMDDPGDAVRSRSLKIGSRVHEFARECTIAADRLNCAV